VTKALDEKLSIGIEHNLDNGRVFEGNAKALAECVLEFADKAGV
jgi:hypothetical protein